MGKQEVGWVVVQFEIRRGRSLISAQGWSAATTLGPSKTFDLTLKGFALRETLSGFNVLLFADPGFSLRSNPGLKLAYAFGVYFKNGPVPIGAGGISRLFSICGFGDQFDERGW